MRPEYHRENLGAGIRGKYLRQYRNARHRNARPALLLNDRATSSASEPKGLEAAQTTRKRR